MPIKQCQLDGKSGWKWGDEGKCYTGTTGKNKAIAQGIAIEGGDISNFTAEKVSVDYDDTASTAKGKELLKRLISEGKIVYIISARDRKFPIVDDLKDIISEGRIWATGSNKNKVEKAKSLGVAIHYDNRQDVVDSMKESGIRGILFKASVQHKLAESYTDYPKQATENAKIALRWAEENGWGSCGTPVGKARANQLAKGEAISRETISRMAGFERHRQNSQKELGDGCGRLMWLAWGGDAGIEWAQRKLKQIEKQNG
jgi:hypothetical protein